MRLYNKGSAAICKQVEDWFRDSSKRTRKWRAEARESYRFYAGDQWTEEDEYDLRRAKRPIVTFNRVAPTIDAVTGAERSNRQETRYLPRTTTESEDDTPVSELWTEAARWVRDECDAEDEESQAFEDHLITGLGWTETWIDFECDQDGQIKIERRNPLQVYFDPDAVKRNLSDSRRVQYAQRMTREEIKEIWPNAKLRGLSDTAIKLDNAEDPHDAEEAKYYRTDQGGRRRNVNDLIVVQTQWWERQPVWRVINPTTGGTEFLTRSELDAVNDALGRELPSLRQVRRVYYQCFVVGKTMLEKSVLHESDDSTIIPGFTFQALTGKRDEMDYQWYGLMRAMRDPQCWSNKFFSQIQDIINSNAKGGLLAEQDAFVNQREAEENWARPDRIVWLNSGAIREGKIQERSSASVPAALDRMLQMAIGAVRDVSGVNVEMAGLASRTQSGVVEQSRIQQGLTTLALFFDSLRRYRKDQGRVLLHFLILYLPDDTLIRVVGSDRYVRFAKDPAVRKFDLIVDQSPTSPSFKQEVWGALQQVVPALARANVPIPWNALLKYTPLPYSVQEEIRKFIKAQEPSQEQQQMRQAASQAELEQLLANVDETKASAQEKRAKSFAQVSARFIDAQKVRNDSERVGNEARKVSNEGDKVAVDGAKVIFDALERGNQPEDNSGTGNAAG